MTDMQLRFLEIDNFLSFGNKVRMEDFGKLNTMVGPNNAGKTNTFRTLEYVAEQLVNTIVERRPYYHKGNHSGGFYIEVGIRFDPDEVQALADLSTCATSFDNINDNTRAETFNKFRKEILRDSSLFHSIFSQEISIIIEDKGQLHFPPEIRVKITNGRNTVFILNFVEFALEPDNSVSRESISQTLFNFFRENGVLDRYSQTGMLNERDSELTSSLDFNWFFERMCALSDNRTHVSFQSVDMVNMERHNEAIIYSKRLQNFMLERNATGNVLHLMSLIGFMFRSSLIRVGGLRSKPESILPDNFESIQIPNVIDGSDLELILFKLKNSSSLDERDRFRSIQDHFSDIMKPLSFDIALRTVIQEEETQQPLMMSPENFSDQTTQYNLRGMEIIGSRTGVKQISKNEPVIYLRNNNYSTPMEYSAAGAFEALLVLTGIIGVKNKVLLLDEPAINLHPSKQIILHRLLSSHTVETNQVFIVTHSPYFVDTKSLHNTWRIGSDNDGCSIIHNVERTLELTRANEKDQSDEQRLFVNPEIRSFLFSAGVIFVEGISDRLVLSIIDEHFSKKYGISNLTSFEFALCDIDGKDNVSKFIRLAKGFGIQYICIVDYDTLMRYGKGDASTIVKYLKSSDSLADEDMSKIKTYEQNIETVNKDQKWYKQEYFMDLSNIASKEHFFVFSTDLEGQLQSQLTRKESKPLKDVMVVIDKIKNGNLKEEEFIKLFNFVSRRFGIKNEIDV